MTVPLTTIIRYCAGAACAAVLGMLGIYLATGIGQDPLQFVHPPAAYTDILLARPPLLRAVIALDNLFIAFYTSVFLALGAPTQAAQVFRRDS